MNELMLAYGPGMIQQFTVLGICSIRLYALMTLFPPTGSSVVTGTVRNGVVLMFSAFVAAAQPPSFAQSLTGLTLLTVGLREALIGTVLGFVASTVFWVAEGAGTYLDNLTGFNNAQISNPMDQQQSTPSATLMSQLAVVAFWTLGGMQFLLGALYESYHWWPVASSTPMSTDFLEVFVMHQTDTLMETIAKLATPMLLGLLLIDMGVNLASKSAQKLELSALSQPIKGAVAVLMLAVLCGVFINNVRDQLDLRLFSAQLRVIAQGARHPLPQAAPPKP
jgi:type III secretion protein T